MKRRLRARPIGTRLFSLLGLGMIAPLLVIVWAGLKARTELEDRSRARDLALASAIAERVSGSLVSGLEVLNSVATRGAWAEMDDLDPFRDEVRRAHLHHHALFDAFFAFDVEGQLVAGDTEGWNVQGSALVAEARRLGRTGLAAGPELSPGVVALVPLFDAQGELKLVVGARLSADSPRLARLLTGKAPVPGQSVALLEPSGKRIAGAELESDKAPLDDETVQRTVAAGQAPRASSCRTCGGGAGASWAVAPVSPAHWSVVLWQPLAQANAFQRELAWDVAVATLVMFLLAGLFAWGATVSVTRPLRALTDAAERIAEGELDVAIGHLPGDEVGTLGAALETMRVSVREAQAGVVKLNAELEGRVARRTKKLETLNAALAVREAERTDLLRRVISAQEGERKRIARELHDETSQQLAALSMGLDAAASTAPEPARAALTRLRGVAASTLSEVHRIILDLRPAVLDDLGLSSAIQWCADRSLRSKGVQVRCEFSGLEERMPWEVETAVFRAAQEALNNVARHSGADAVLVQLQVRDGVLALEVEDDGHGFDLASMSAPSPTGRGLGLLGMRERVESFGGKLSIDSALEQGTMLRVEITLPKERHHG